MSYLDGVNKTDVSPQLLEEVVTMHSALPAEDRASFEGRAFHLFNFLNDKGLQNERSDLSVAIHFRLEALAHLIANQEALGWSFPAEEGQAEMVRPEIIRCAALEPLIEGENGRPGFEPEAFRKRLWAMTKMEGTA